MHYGLPLEIFVFQAHVRNCEVDQVVLRIKTMTYTSSVFVSDKLVEVPIQDTGRVVVVN